MNKQACEEIQLAAMALADGEKAAISPSEIEEHLAGCSECRRELEGMEVLRRLFEQQRRPEHTEELWPVIAPKLSKPARSSGAAAIWPYALLVFVLLVGRGLAWATDGITGLSVRLLLVLFTVTLFWLRQENPFVLNPQLTIENQPYE